MRKRIGVVVLLILGLSSWSIAQDQFNVLLFSKTAGFHHVSINEGVDAITALGKRHHFMVDWQESADVFNPKNLERFQVIIFLNTTGDILNEEQQKAMEEFIRSGKGFVGIHSAADTEYEWDWYTKMLGRMFKIHPKIQTAKLRVVNGNFPGMETMPNSRIWTDEWYQYQEELSDDLNYLIRVDENTFNAKVQWGDNIGEGMGDFHPMAWYHQYDGGRAYYTGLGHVPATFSDPIFLDQLAGAIWWAATGKGID
ncbi:MAG: ThuA domain-containing protein [Saprospiraceae bacterium]|nr:ThuA domain-containing protein [Saprospiraceae bacterium]